MCANPETQSILLLQIVKSNFRSESQQCQAPDTDFFKVPRTHFMDQCAHVPFIRSRISAWQHLLLGMTDMMPTPIPFHSGCNKNKLFFFLVHSVFMLRVGTSFGEVQFLLNFTWKVTAKITCTVNILITARTMLVFLFQSHPQSRIADEETATLAQIKALFLFCFN